MRGEIKHVVTAFGDIAYGEQGEGPPALFVHGVLLNGYMWRHVIAGVADLRRCVHRRPARPRRDTDRG